MNHYLPNRRRLPAALLPLLLMLAAVGPVLAVDGVIEINQASWAWSSIIVTPGSYRLTSNIVVPPNSPGFQIVGNDVTLDLNGFAIIGGGGTLADGVSITGNNVEVRNGTIKLFSRNGVFQTSGRALARVIGVRTTNNTFSGIELQGVGNTVDGCTAMTNESTGIRAGDFSIVMNSVVSQNDGFGLSMGATTGYRSNVVTLNDAGDILGGIQLGSNICGIDLICP